MAHEKLEWEFKLKDSVSGAAGKIAKSAHHTHSAFQQLIHTFHDLEELGEKAFEKFEGIFEFGKEAFEAMEFKEHALIGLEAVTQSADMARGIYKNAEDFALATGQSAQKMIGATQRLAAAGFKNGDDLRTLMQVLTDSEIINPGSFETVEEALVKMKTSGHLTERTMLALNSVAGLGGKVQKQLADGLHVSTDELKKLIEAGKVSADWGAFAIAKGMADLEGGKLGTVTAKIAESVGGAAGQVREAFQKEMRNLIDPEALKPVADFLVRVAHEGIPALAAGFKEAAPSIKELIDAFKGVVGEGASIASTFRSIGQAIGYAAKAAVLLVESLKYIREFGVTGGVGQMISDKTGLSSAAEGLEKKLVDKTGLAAWAKEHGYAISYGVADGVKSGASATTEAVGKMGEAAKGEFADKLEIHSPSRVFQEFGEQASEGFNLGVASNPMHADLPTVSSSAAGGRRSVTISPQFHFTIQGSPGGASGGGAEGSRRLADHIVDLAMEKLVGMFEELQIEGGA